MRLPYSLILLGRERGRYLPAILAVAFCAQLNILQWGVLLGTLSVLSIPIDRSEADVWVASRDVLSLELGHPIPTEWESRVASQPEVERTETYLFSFGFWHKPTGGSEVCTVVGSQLGQQAAGALADLTPEMRSRLTEPGAVVVDAAELERLGIQGVGDTAEVFGHRVSVVGLLHGFKSVGGPYVFCSLRTARMILPMFQEKPHDTMYLLARCRDSAAAHELIEHLRRYPDFSAFTRDEFSLRTRWYWLTQTNAGIGMGFTAALALLVGLVVTSQTLYAATIASLREYAVLQALGISRWRMGAMVLAQSFWVGLFGIAVAMPVIFALGSAANFAGARVLLPTWLFAGGNALTMAMALVSGLAALRSLRLVEPIALLLASGEGFLRMSSAKPTLEGRHLFRSFGSGDTKATVLQDVSLDLQGGQVSLMMGPSGSGKSTLLAVLSGLLRPDSGDVIALGQNLWQMSESKQRRFRLRHCGFIFQGFNLFPSLTPREQLEMVLRWGERASPSEAGRRVEEALTRLGLGHRGDLTADQLSGGEKQRVAIARALLKAPTFCFADEPTSSLDWKNGEQVIQLLRAAAHERGATIFIVAHDARIVPYADRVYYLEDGRLSGNAEPRP